MSFGGPQGAGMNLAGIAGASLSESGQGALDFEHYYDEGKTPVSEEVEKFPLDAPAQMAADLPDVRPARRWFRLPHIR